MTDLEKFDKVWNGAFLPSAPRKYTDPQTARGKATQKRYEEILFSIWKHHNDWDDDSGFQLKCFYKECPEFRTLYRVRKLAEEAGLLIKTRNYAVDDHPNEYHKNTVLFDKVFRDKNNKYGKWLNETHLNPDKDIIGNLLKDDFDNIEISSNNYYKKLVSKSERIKNKISKLNYDIDKLYSISDKMLDRYYSLLLKLNKAAVHDELKFITFVHYDNNGFPTGRPYSYFCSTGNDNKKHKDPSLELRSQFLKRIGLPDYFEVYDIKSEVPRVNWLFHTGEWKEDSYDFYTEIVKDTEMMKYTDWAIERGETKYTKYEDSMKQIFMRIYFGKGSDHQSFNGWLDDKLKRLGNDWMKYWIQEENGFEINYDIWSLVCDSTRKIVGPSIGNLVFWFSFFIETEVKIELLERGKKVYNVYDGFYYKEDIKNEIVEILESKSKYVYNKYMKVIIK